MSQVQLTAPELAQLQQLLGPWIDLAVVFGSRATGRSKQFSDVDICLVGDVPRSEVTLLRDRCEESTFPFVVDVSRFEDLSEDFKKAVARDGVKLAGL